MTSPDTLAFHVTGAPVGQGSMRRTANGRMYHANTTRLDNWRYQILATALATGRAHNWQLPLNEPVEIWARFTVPAPERRTKGLNDTHPATSGDDLDKLARAIGDALSPRHGQKFLENDRRIIGWYLRKDYGVPGVDITITKGLDIRPSMTVWTSQDHGF